MIDHFTRGVLLSLDASISRPTAEIHACEYWTLRD
jgi:hypothetical protein